ncbi:MAG: DinB family protein [Pyrinomonadaceae bacterium]
MSNIRTFVEEFKVTIETAATRLHAISDTQSQLDTNDRAWCPKQIIGHLIDSAAHNHQRFVRAQFKDDLRFEPYEQDRWVELQQYTREPWHRLVDLWKNYNLHLAHLISNIPAGVLQTQRTQHNLDQIAWQTVETDQPTTLDYFIRDYVGHLRHHLAQIFPGESD